MPGRGARPARQPRPARAARVHARRRQGAARRRSRRSRSPSSTTWSELLTADGHRRGGGDDPRPSAACPTPVVHTRLRAPASRMGPADDVDGAAKASPLCAKYGERVDSRERARDARRAARGAASRCRRPSPTHGARPRSRRRRRRKAAGAGTARRRRLPAARARARRSQKRGRARRLRDAEEAACERRRPAVHRGARGAARGDAGVRGDASCARTRPSGRTRAGSRTRCSRMAELGYLGLKYRRRTAARAATTCTTRCSSEELAARGSGGLSAGDRRAHRRSPRRRSGEVRHRGRRGSAACARDPRREDRARSAITEPGAGSDVAGHPHARRARRRRLGRQRRQDVHHQRRARGLLRHRRAHDARRAGHRGAVVPGRRGGRGRRPRRQLEKLGWHASDTAEIAFEDVFVPDEHLLGEEDQRLLPDHGQLPVGAAADGARRGRLDARDARAR